MADLQGWKHRCDLFALQDAAERHGIDVRTILPPATALARTHPRGRSRSDTRKIDTVANRVQRNAVFLRDVAPVLFGGTDATDALDRARAELELWAQEDLRVLTVLDEDYPAAAIQGTASGPGATLTTWTAA